MTVEYKQHYVAFLDVLGFKEMVADDLQYDKNQHLLKLYKCHTAAAGIFNDPSYTITQFSDSVVIAKPYDANAFSDFVKHVAEYQRLLLDEELLCRGGVAVNKHFSNGSFTFSAGLISAYQVESTTARYPRVVISPEVLSLVFPGGIKSLNYLVEENDGLWFIDYLGITKNNRKAHMIKSVLNIVTRLTASPIASVREKGRWLASYSDAILKSNLRKPQFRSVRIRGAE
jgi:hypothetical protein